MPKRKRTCRGKRPKHTHTRGELALLEGAAAQLGIDCKAVVSTIAWGLDWALQLQRLRGAGSAALPWRSISDIAKVAAAEIERARQLAARERRA